MRLDRFITLGLAWPLAGVQARRQHRRLPIFMYHGINDSAEPGTHPYYRVNTPPAVFGQHMAVLDRDGYVGVSLEDGLDWLHEDSVKEAGGRSGRDHAVEPRRLAAITFDDGFRDFLTHAHPVLQRHGFSATMFLPAAHVGNAAGGVNCNPCLSWKEVQDLRCDGIRFGSHTVSHPKLVDLSWSEVERELRDSKAVIEERLGETISSFAHPYAFPQERADYVQRLVSLLQQCNYRYGVTTRIGCARATDSPYTLKRLPMNGLDDERLVRAKVLGAYDWLGRLQYLSRKLRYCVRKNRPTLESTGSHMRSNCA